MFKKLFKKIEEKRNYKYNARRFKMADDLRKGSNNFISEFGNDNFLIIPDFLQKKEKGDILEFNQ